MVMREQVVWSPTDAQSSLNPTTDRLGALGWVTSFSDPATSQGESLASQTRKGGRGGSLVPLLLLGVTGMVVMKKFQGRRVPSPRIKKLIPTRW